MQRISDHFVILGASTRVVFNKSEGCQRMHPHIIVACPVIQIYDAAGRTDVPAQIVSSP